METVSGFDLSAFNRFTPASISLNTDSREIITFSEDLEVFRDFFYDVTYGEDYITGYGVQKGVNNVGGTTQLYGRNEPGVQYVHQTINRIMKENHVDGMALPKEA